MRPCSCKDQPSVRQDQCVASLLDAFFSPFRTENGPVVPDEPLALRLSANLLLGVAKVSFVIPCVAESDSLQLYGQQIAFFFTDVERVHDLLKAGISLLSISGG